MSEICIGVELVEISLDRMISTSQHGTESFCNFSVNNQDDTEITLVFVSSIILTRTLLI